MLGPYFYFWQSWTGEEPPPPPPPDPDPDPDPPIFSSPPAGPANAGGGGKSKRKPANYEPMSEEYWLERERLLRPDKRDPNAIFREEDPTPSPIAMRALQSRLKVLRDQRAALISPDVFATITDVAGLKAIAAQLATIDEAIKKIHK